MRKTEYTFSTLEGGKQIDNYARANYHKDPQIPLENPQRRTTATYRKSNAEIDQKRVDFGFEELGVERGSKLMPEEAKDPRKYYNKFNCTFDFAEAWNNYVDAVDRKKQIKEKLEKLKMNVETENKTNERTN